MFLVASDRTYPQALFAWMLMLASHLQGRVERAARWGRVAVGLSREMGSPFWQGLSLVSRRAASLAARCEGAMTPALQAIGTRVVLTQAEREVALLAAAGRSNKEIAEQLYLSLRTVENYLHRAYEKLGVSGRAELTAALEA